MLSDPREKKMTDISICLVKLATCYLLQKENETTSCILKFSSE